MVEESVDVMQIIRRFENQLNEMGIRVERLWLFGSQARGLAVEGSDIDLVVISPDWAGMSERERLELLGVAAARILEPVQAQGFTPEEVEKGEISAFWQVVLHAEAVAVE
ncbi:MAG: nucleotidyltransferase domain-containing protein [Anaerolineae bacterium]|nr:MAG: nucleotidyltransferase domain-containing protein [Anaerolineae bacterium]